MEASALPVILAGGLGTRLGALSEGLPKPMVPVGGRPFLEHVVRQLAGLGFPEALLLVGHRAETIQAHFGDGDGFGLGLRYSREPEPLGTGGALKLAAPLIPERFLLLYGDLYRDFDYRAFCARHGQALAVYPYVPGLTTIACANVGLDAEGRFLRRYVKGEPAAGLAHVDAGFGVFHRDVLDLLPEGRSSFEERVYPALAAAGTLEAERVDRDFLDIGNPDDLAHARARLSTP
jgi:D-glycero-D-manno-heptose 1,7-bisphosphate phosphatase